MKSGRPHIGMCGRVYRPSAVPVAERCATTICDEAPIAGVPRSGVPVRPACLTDRLTSDRSVRQGVAMVRRTGADTKREILIAATRLFGDFGYRGTSLADIAHEIGYSKASVLYHFASKEALLAELIAPAAADLRALLARVSALPLAQARSCLLYTSDAADE